MDTQTPSQSSDKVVQAAPAGEEHAAPETVNVETAGDELQASGPYVTGHFVPVNDHPIGADAETESPTAVGKPDSQSYIPLIDEFLMEADLETITRGQIRRWLAQRLGRDLRKEEINELINSRFELRAAALEAQTSGVSSTPADKEDLGDDVSDGSEKMKSPAEIIDLTNYTDDPGSGDGIAATHPRLSLGKAKRKRDDPNSQLNSSKACDGDPESRSTTKRARQSRAAALPKPRQTAVLSRILVKPEEVKIDTGRGNYSYQWDWRREIWSGTGGQCTILGPLPRGLRFVSKVKVRPQGDKEPVYLTRERGPDNEVVFQGTDIDQRTVEVTLGEMGSMLSDPEGGPYVGYFM